MQLQEYYEDKRESAITLTWARNLVTSFAFFIFFTLAGLCMLQMYTFCDLTSIFGPSGLKYVSDFGGLVEVGDDRHAGAKVNRLAFLVAFLVQLFYWIFAFLIYFIVYLVTGFFFHTWDTTMWHNSGWWGVWFATCLLGGFVVWVLLRLCWKAAFYCKGIRKFSTYYSPHPEVQDDETGLTELVMNCYHKDHVKGPSFKYAKPEAKKPSFMKKCCAWFCDKEHDASPHVYCVKFYLAWWTLVVYGALIAGSCMFCAIIPISLSDFFVTRTNLKWRFRLMSFLLMGIPLLLFSILTGWVKGSEWNARWDHVFSMKAAGDCRAMLAEKKSLDTPKAKSNKYVKYLLMLLDNRGVRAARVWNLLHHEPGKCPVDSLQSHKHTTAHLESEDLVSSPPLENASAPTLTPGLPAYPNGTPWVEPNRSQVADKLDYYDMDDYADPEVEGAAFMSYPGGTPPGYPAAAVSQAAYPSGASSPAPGQYPPQGPTVPPQHGGVY